MQKTVFSLIALTGIICFSQSIASSVATITALQPPVWSQRNNTKTELNSSSILKIGDHIVTGDTGRVEIQLWTSTTLQLNTNSEITIRAVKESEKEAINIQQELSITKGRACVKYMEQSTFDKKLILVVGNAMFADLQPNADICVLRNDGLSSIKLRDGSVQVTHSVDPNMIILGDTGTELHIEDNGSYKLLFPGIDDSSTPEIEKPFTVETAIEKEFSGGSPDTVDSNMRPAVEVIKTESGASTQEQMSEYVYTVYLFSTRSEEIAKQVNKKFHNAGYDTEIYESKSGSESRYRIAASGFESRQAAQKFSDSIVGKHGIKTTWIGKSKR